MPENDPGTFENAAFIRRCYANKTVVAPGEVINLKGEVIIFKRLSQQF